MATAAEGKTMGDTLDECGACKVNLPVKYCVECKINLCNMCTNTHKNIPFTKDHKLTDIQTSKRGMPSTMSQPKCHTHNNQPLSHLCNTCIELICVTCNGKHSGHDILQLKGDPKSYNKVYTKHVKQLLDELHEVESMKTMLEGHIKTYDEAITAVDQWELDLLKLVKHKAARLRMKIHASRDTKVKQLSDKMNGLVLKIQEIDKTITKLNDIRRSIDPQVLVTELAKSQALISKLESYKVELKTPSPSLGVKSMLPNENKITYLGNILDEIFDFKDVDSLSLVDHNLTLPSKYKGPKPVAAWRFTESNGGKDLSVYAENPVIMKGVKYGLGPHGEKNGAVLLPPSKDQSMIVMSPTDKLRFTSEMTYYTNVFIDGKTMGALFEYNTGVTNSMQRGSLLWVWDNEMSLTVAHTGFDMNGTDVLRANSWNKIALVWNQSALCVYLNGQEVHRKAGTLQLSTEGHIHMGYSPGYSHFVSGRMATAMFFDCALTANQISDLCS